MQYAPPLDSALIVDLPSERLRATVRRVADRNTVLVELTALPMAKTHQFKKGDIVICRRNAGLLGETWIAEGDGREMLTQPVKKEEPHAPDTGKGRDRPKHKGAGKKRKAKAASAGNRAGHSKKASDDKRWAGKNV